MKVIRLTDDRYIIDAGAKIRHDVLDQLNEQWNDWWKTHTEAPTALFVGGSEMRLEYEDHRDPDAVQMARIEEKLDRLLDILS